MKEGAFFLPAAQLGAKPERLLGEDVSHETNPLGQSRPDRRQIHPHKFLLDCTSGYAVQFLQFFPKYPAQLYQGVSKPLHLGRRHAWFLVDAAGEYTHLGRLDHTDYA